MGNGMLTESTLSPSASKQQQRASFQVDFPWLVVAFSSVMDVVGVVGVGR